eukprot:g740.t1
MSLSRALHRSLLRAARALDRNPLGKALLLAQPDRLFCRQGPFAGQLLHLAAEERRKAIDETCEDVQPASVLLNALQRQVNGGSEFYLPPQQPLQGQQQQQQQQQQQGRERVSSIEKQVMALSRRSFGAFELDTAATAQLGFGALRAMNAAANAGAALRPSDREAVSIAEACERLVPAFRVQHAAAGPVKVGSLLVTHPVACLQQPTLHRAVILIVSVTDVQVIGVILNKPLEQTVQVPEAQEPSQAAVSVLARSYWLDKGEADGDVAKSDEAEQLKHFAALRDDRVHLGGDVQVQQCYHVLLGADDGRGDPKDDQGDPALKEDGDDDDDEEEEEEGMRDDEYYFRKYTICGDEDREWYRDKFQHLTPEEKWEIISHGWENTGRDVRYAAMAAEENTFKEMTQPGGRVPVSDADLEEAFEPKAAVYATAEEPVAKDERKQEERRAATSQTRTAAHARVVQALRAQTKLPFKKLDEQRLDAGGLLHKNAIYDGHLYWSLDLLSAAKLIGEQSGGGNHDKDKKEEEEEEKQQQQEGKDEGDDDEGGEDGGGLRVEMATHKIGRGYAGWLLPQLQLELQRNVWLHLEPADAASGTALALMELEEGHEDDGGSGGGVAGGGGPASHWHSSVQQVRPGVGIGGGGGGGASSKEEGRQGEDTSEGTGGGARAGPSGGATGLENKKKAGNDNKAKPRGDLLWRACLWQLGGEHRDLCLFPEDRTLVNEVAGDMFEAHYDELRERMDRSDTERLNGE